MNRTEALLFKAIRLVLIFMVVIAFNWWFMDHYTELLKNSYYVIRALCVIDVSLVVLFVSIYYYKNLINPVSLYSIFIFAWGYSYLPLSLLQTSEYSWYTEIILILTVISFLLGTMWNKPGKELSRTFFKVDLLRFIIYVVVLFCLIAFVSEIRQIGYLPIFNLSVKNYANVVKSLIPFVHYLVLFLSLVPAIAYIYYKNGIISVYAFLAITAISFFVFVNLLGRQNVLMLFLSVFFAYNYFKKISNVRIIIFLCVWVAFFIYMGSLRDDAASLEIVNSALKHYAWIKLDTSLLETYLTLYSSQNFTTLDKIVNLATMNGYAGFGIYTFKPAISLLFIDRIGLINYPPAYDGVMQLGTYAIEPFLDFRLFGVILINFFYGRISILVYNQYMAHKNYFSIISWSLVAFCLIMTAFTNYFDMFLIWFALILSYIALNLKTMKTKELINSQREA